MNINSLHNQNSKFYLSQQGIGIVEVMVALLLLAVSILGFSAMQVRAVKATGESVDRTQALAVMRSASEKIRANSNALGSYQSNFSDLYQSIKAGKDMTVPSKRCGIASSTDDSCTPNELAAAETYDFYLNVKNAGFNMNMVACPATGGASNANAATNVMYSYCLIAAWDRTTPTVGSDDTFSSDTDTMDCLSTTGVYHAQSTCMFMEIN